MKCEILKYITPHHVLREMSIYNGGQTCMSLKARILNVYDKGYIKILSNYNMCAQYQVFCHICIMLIELTELIKQGKENTSRYFGAQ